MLDIVGNNSWNTGVSSASYSIMHMMQATFIILLVVGWMEDCITDSIELRGFSKSIFAKHLVTGPQLLLL
jgi:hypothetical protein